MEIVYDMMLTVQCPHVGFSTHINNINLSHIVFNIKQFINALSKALLKRGISTRQRGGERLKNEL